MSLRGRLLSAMLLIACCLGALQLEALRHANAMQQASAALVRVSANVGHAHQIERLVDDLRTAASIHLAGGSEATMAASAAAMTDAAIGIGEQVNALNLAGMPDLIKVLSGRAEKRAATRSPSNRPGWTHSPRASARRPKPQKRPNWPARRAIRANGTCSCMWPD